MAMTYQRQMRRSLYCAANKLRGTFIQCLTTVKIVLFLSLLHAMYVCMPIVREVYSVVLIYLCITYDNAHGILHYMPRNFFMPLLFVL